jgi:hypothetical protein
MLEEGPIMSPFTTRIAAVLTSAILTMPLLSFCQDAPDKYPPGTKIMVRLDQPLSSASAILGQEWDGTLVNAVPIGNKVVAPSGSQADGIVSAVKRPGRLKGSGSVSLILVHANGIPVKSDILTRDGDGHVKSNMSKIASGALLGAGIGGAVGGGTGALIGAAAGAGGGTVVADATNKHAPELNAETVLTFTQQ